MHLLNPNYFFIKNFRLLTVITPNLSFEHRNSRIMDDLFKETVLDVTNLKTHISSFQIWFFLVPDHCVSNDN